jgi:hypothetical protein
MFNIISDIKATLIVLQKDESRCNFLTNGTRLCAQLSDYAFQLMYNVTQYYQFQTRFEIRSNCCKMCLRPDWTSCT